MGRPQLETCQGTRIFWMMMMLLYRPYLDACLLASKSLHACSFWPIKSLSAEYCHLDIHSLNNTLNNYLIYWNQSTLDIFVKSKRFYHKTDYIKVSKIRIKITSLEYKRVPKEMNCRIKILF